MNTNSDTTPKTYTNIELAKLFENKDYRPISLKNYVSSLQSISKRMIGARVPKTKVSDWFSLDLFNEKLIELKPVSKRNYLSSTIALIKALDNSEDINLFKELSTTRDEYTREYEEKCKEGSLTPTEKTKWITPQELSDAYEKKIIPFLARIGLTKNGKLTASDTYDPVELRKIREYVILSLYFWPFFGLIHGSKERYGVLRNDLDHVVLSRGGKTVPDANTNLIHTYSTKRMVLVMNSYKTVSTYGQVIIPVPQALAVILRQYIKFMEINPGDVIFEGLQKVHITNLLNKSTSLWFERQIGSSTLRKIFVSYKFGEQIQDQRDTAEAMLHSPGVQASIYNRNIET